MRFTVHYSRPAADGPLWEAFTDAATLAEQAPHLSAMVHTCQPRIRSHVATETRRIRREF
jgi:hypothetical protein